MDTLEGVRQNSASNPQGFSRRRLQRVGGKRKSIGIKLG